MSLPRRTHLAAVALLSATVLTACSSESAAPATSESSSSTPTSTDAGSSETSSAEGDPIVIGIASGQTGFFSAFDVPVKNAIELAVADLNAEGGILGRPVEIVVSDTKSDIGLSASAGIEILDKGADFVVTNCDYNLGAPAAQEAGKAGKVALSCAGSALFGPVGVGPLAYSVNESSTTQASIGAQFASDQGWKTAYLLGDTGEDFTSSWCSSFEQSFTELGGEIVGKDTFVQGDTSIAPQVSTLTSSGLQPDVIALCGYPPTGSTAISQLRSAGVDAPIVTTSGFDGPGWLEAVPDVSDVYAVTSASIYGDDPNPAVNDLVAAYSEQYGAPSSSYLVYGTAIVETIKAAAEAAGSVEGEAVAQALDAFADQPTIIGETTYSAGCHAATGRAMRIIEYGNGTGAYLTTVSPLAGAVPEGCSS